MAGRRARAGLAVAAIALTVTACGSGSNASSDVTVTLTRTRVVTTTRTVTTTPKPPTSAAACSGSQLTGTFALLPGSAGAGQVVYTLKLTNTSQTSCFVSGIPQAQLLGASGSSLPTQVVAAQPGTGTAAMITLTSGASAAANARFSPDVSGQGDSQGSACQPTAHTLRVTLSGGSIVDAPIKPPTSVCEQGRLTFALFSATG